MYEATRQVRVGAHHAALGVTEARLLSELAPLRVRNRRGDRAADAVGDEEQQEPGRKLASTVVVPSAETNAVHFDGLPGTSSQTDQPERSA